METPVLIAPVSRQGAPECRQIRRERLRPRCRHSDYAIMSDRTPVSAQGQGAGSRAGSAAALASERQLEALRRAMGPELLSPPADSLARTLFATRELEQTGPA